ncbi:MAG TPA: hypothetical protein VFN76_05875, partial [Candidatus Limnocylindria bacterium]|nr:hypothetical protein [Candidatus Limnocylindria bacterium]
RILAVVSLVAAGWVIVIIGFAIPIFTGALLEAAGVIDRNFDVEAIHYLALVGAIVLAPPAVAGGLVIGEFRDERTVSEWLRLIPVSYPATFLLGLAVLEMVAFTPFLLIQRWRQKRTLVQVPLVMKEGTDDDDLVEAVRAALRSVGIEDVSVTEATGPKAWPMRTVGFAARHLLGAVVRGDPMRLKADGLEIFAYATNVAVLGPTEDAHRVRAAVERELAFRDAYLTWSDDSQRIEDELTEARKAANGDIEGLRRRLDEVQERMDAASLNSEEWNVLYRMRLQVEQAASRRRDDAGHH